jgi:cysteine synthase B
MRGSSLLDFIGNTPLVELQRFSPRPGVRIFAKLEGENPSGSLKDRIVKYMLEDAERSGKLTKDRVLLEPTSGNTGISLAMIGRIKGYRVQVVMPENVTEERVTLLQSYGAEITYSDGKRGTNGSVELAQKMCAEDPRYYMLYQYGNENNPRAHYETTAAEIIRDLPDVDVFVSGLGTGGTLMGVGRRLREHNPAVRIVAVAPHPEEIIQGLRSLEEGFIPPIIDLDVLSSRLMIRSRESFMMTKKLMEKESIFAGISSGAVMAGAVRVAEGMERGNIVALLADSGWKYLSTKLWLRDVDELTKNVGTKIWW